MPRAHSERRRALERVLRIRGLMASSDDQTHISGSISERASIKAPLNDLNNFVLHYGKDVLPLVVSLLIDLSSSLYEECASPQLKIAL